MHSQRSKGRGGDYGIATSNHNHKQLCITKQTDEQKKKKQKFDKDVQFEQ